MDKPTKPTDLVPRSFGGVKNNFSASLQSSGYEDGVPAIYGGDNLNYQLDATGKELDYCEKIADFINGIPIGKTITVDSNNKLVYDDLAQEVPIATTETAGIVKPDGETITIDENGIITAKSMSRNIGEIVASTIPLTDAGLHLLDGALIDGSGSYSAFVDYIADLYADNPTADYFTDEVTWQSAVTAYGVCGKFVYDSTNSTVRLPKYSNKIYTKGINSTASVVGNGMTLGLTNGVANVGLFSAIGSGNISMLETAESAYGEPVGSTNVNTGRSNYNTMGVTSDGSKSGLIAELSNITTSLDGYYYIVVATSTKTDIQVDIDQIATDLNGKADTDLSNVSNTSGFRKLIDIYNNGTSWYKVFAEYNISTGDYIGKWCVQGGVTTIANNTQITFAKPFVDANYQGHITERVSFPYNAGQQNCRFYPTSTTYATCCSGLTGGLLCQWFAMGYIN